MQPTAQQQVAQAVVAIPVQQANVAAGYPQQLVHVQQATMCPQQIRYGQQVNHAQPAMHQQQVFMCTQQALYAQQGCGCGQYCRAPWCGCSPLCGAVTFVVFQSIFFTFSLIGVGLGLTPAGSVQGLMMFPAMPSIFLSMLVLILAAGRAGCCSYSPCNCCCNQYSIFHDHPKAKCAFGIMIAALVLMCIDVFFLASSVSCIYSYNNDIYNNEYIAPQCTFFALWTFLAHSLALASTILFCKNEKERTASQSSVQQPAQCGVQMQTMQQPGVQQLATVAQVMQQSGVQQLATVAQVNQEVTKLEV
jgi:hypothetical protein